MEASADAVDELVAEGVVSTPGESADDRLARQFDAALDGSEVDRQLQQLTNARPDHDVEGDDGTKPLQD
jgi:phage shock protein A